MTSNETLVCCTKTKHRRLMAEDWVYKLTADSVRLKNKLNGYTLATEVLVSLSVLAAPRVMFVSDTRKLFINTQFSWDICYL